MIKLIVIRIKRITHWKKRKKNDTQLIQEGGWFKTQEEGNWKFKRRRQSPGADHPDDDEDHDKDHDRDDDDDHDHDDHDYDEEGDEDSCQVPSFI